MSTNNDLTLSRRKSSNDNVEYGQPIILSENSRTRIQLIPWYIKHSDHTELSIKIQTMQKTDPPINWVEIEKKSITLQSEATNRLSAELPRLMNVAQQDESGEYIVIRAADGTVNLNGLQPEDVTTALLSVLGQDEILEHLRGRDLGQHLASALKYSVRLEEMKSAVAELRANLDGGVTLEKEYQKWCEKYPWAFGNQFVVNDEIREISPQDSVDILMPRIMAGYRDIVELKRPDMSVLQYDAAHRNYYFSSEVTKAIGQCHRYLDVFCEVAGNGLIADRSIVAYHPEATIVIGRSNDWTSDKIKALHGLNSRLSGITIITYDHLLAQGENLVDYLSSEMANDDEEILF